MPREASLFEQSGGSVFRAYLLLKNAGSANIPPNWIERAKESRKHREEKVAQLLRDGKIKDLPVKHNPERHCFGCEGSHFYV